MSSTHDPTVPDRNLALELVRVTESAAMGAARWIGRGDKNAADGAAVDLMRRMINTVTMQGVVVIGEGEKDEAPMLFNSERVGAGFGPEVDVAVDPLEGTRLTALGIPGSISVIAVAERGSMFFPGAALYMEKIAVGPEAADAIDLQPSPTENVQAVAAAKGMRVSDLTVVVLERERHDDADRGAPRLGGPREPDPRRRRRAFDRRLPALDRGRHADGDRRHARRASSPQPRSSAWAARSRGGCGRATTTSAQALVDGGLRPRPRARRPTTSWRATTSSWPRPGVTGGSLLRGVRPSATRGRDGVDRDAIALGHRAPDRGLSTRATSSRTCEWRR